MSPVRCIDYMHTATLDLMIAAPTATYSDVGVQVEPTIAVASIQVEPQLLSRSIQAQCTMPNQAIRVSPYLAACETQTDAREAIACVCIFSVDVPNHTYVRHRIIVQHHRWI